MNSAIKEFHVEQLREKPRMVRVTEPAEIAALERNALPDPIGGKAPDGSWWAYSWSLERYRAELARAAGATP